MLKLTAIISLILFAMWSQADSKRYKKEATASGDFDPASALWASGLPCDSCGSECAAACGTRHFRSCCFNYLRRKRGPDGTRFYPHNPYELVPGSRIRPVYYMDTRPEDNILIDFPSYLKRLVNNLHNNFENRPQYD